MSWKEHRGEIILCSFTVFFTAVMLVVSFVKPDDGQLYQTVSGLLTGFAGALLMRLTPGKEQPPPGSVTTTSLQQTTKTPQAQEQPEAGGMEIK